MLNHEVTNQNTQLNAENKNQVSNRHISRVLGRHYSFILWVTLYLRHEKYCFFFNRFTFQLQDKALYFHYTNFLNSEWFIKFKHKNKRKEE